MTKFVRSQGSAPIEERIMSASTSSHCKTSATRVAHKAPNLGIRRPLLKEAPPQRETGSNASQCSNGVLVQERGARRRKIGFGRSRRSSVALSECRYMPRDRISRHEIQTRNGTLVPLSHVQGGGCRQPSPQSESERAGISPVVVSNDFQTGFSPLT